MTFLEVQVDHKNELPIDLALGEYLGKHEAYQGFMVEGDFFRHIGYYSSVQKEKREAKEFLLLDN